MELQHVVYILLAFLLARFWWLTNRAREQAEQQAKMICDRENVQLLDGTVALSKMQLKHSSGLHFYLVRHFKFEFSVYGAERRMGMIALKGFKQEYVFLDLPKPTIDIEANTSDV